MSMQTNAEFRKEQIGTLIVWVGALEGRGIWGVGGPSGESIPKSGHAFPKKTKNSLLVFPCFSVAKKSGMCSTRAKKSRH